MLLRPAKAAIGSNMNEFQIHVRRDNHDQPDEPQGIMIRTDSVVLTDLLRGADDQPDDHLKAPPANLAFWLVDHWWRLRWECMPPHECITPEWQQAHELSSVGGGYAWPRVTIWGDGQRVGLISKADPPDTVGPVRFQSNALVFIDGGTYEAAVDKFLAETADADQGFGSDREALRSIINALSAERADPDVAQWRRFEAIAGFDVDEAPDSLTDSLEGLISRYSAPDIEEAVYAAPGEHASQVLNNIVQGVRESSFAKVNFTQAVRICSRELDSRDEEPWILAETASSMLRSQISAGSRPLRNRNLSELVEAETSVLHSRSSGTYKNAPYGVRLRTDDSARDHVFLRNHKGFDRRFEIARCLGDAVWTNNSPLGPISRSGTARQKFQRAFAASLLCPYDALIDFLATDSPTDGRLFDAARYFHVSERVVRSVLVNKKIIQRYRLHLPVTDLRNEKSIEELAEAA